MHLGGEHDVVAAAAGERLADDLLRLAARVDVGGVDEVDAGVEGRVDDRDALVVVRVAPGAEHHRPEAERGDLDAGAAERAVVHRADPSDVARAWRASVISVTTDAARSSSSWTWWLLQWRGWLSITHSVPRALPSPSISGMPA